MRLLSLNDKQRFYRGNLHGHSTHSDGLLSPRAVIDCYAGLGYDFTSLSDHLWIDDGFAAGEVFNPNNFNSKKFIVLPSAELHCHGKRFDQDGLWHIVANGLPIDFGCPSVSETVPDLIARALASGAFVSLAHPEWYSMTTEEALTVAAADAVEIYNYSCVLSSARGSGIAIADFLLNEGKKVSFVAADDSHFHFPDYGGGWVMVASPELSQNAIIEALKAGHYYSSTGSDFIEISVNADLMTVRTSPVDSVVVSGEGHTALSKHDKNITCAQFDLSQLCSKWFRITIRSATGQMAWSNPFFRNQF